MAKWKIIIFQTLVFRNETYLECFIQETFKYSQRSHFQMEAMHLKIDLSLTLLRSYYC